MRYPTALLGVPVDTLSMTEAVDHFFSLVQQGKEDRVARYVATVNSDFFVNIYNCWTGGLRSPDLLHVLRRADLVLADGMPLVWLSWLLGGDLQERIPGASMVPLVAARAAKQGNSLFLLGGEPSVTSRAAETLQRQFPGLKIAGCATPVITIPDNSVDDALLEELELVAPDILLIGLGSPKQELWFDRNRDRLHVPVSIGVGGTFKFLAGAVARAPGWMQNLGLEWLYRWMQEPKLLTKRYLRDLLEFPLLTIPVIFGQMLTEYIHASDNGFVVQIERYGQPLSCLHFPSVLNKQTRAHVIDLIQTVPSDEVPILDFFATRGLDPLGAGILLELYRRNKGLPLKSEGITAHMEKLLKLHRVWDSLKVSVQSSRRLGD